ncbi:Piwi-domain-containing protein [Poronia punctata]|nr:Piwi-domain-containing protein [Poronia punctata]
MSDHRARSGSGRASGLEGLADLNIQDGSSRGSVSGRSRSGSQPNSPAKSSQGPSTSPTGTAVATSGRDEPRREKTTTELVGMRVDLGADAYNTDKKGLFANRPAFNTEGKPIPLDINVFRTRFQDMEIYQYDVAISPNLKESRSLIKKVWNTPEVQEFLEQEGGKWLFDGNKLAWSSKKIFLKDPKYDPKKNEPREARLKVDLDAGKPNRSGDRGVHYVRIRQSTIVHLAYLNNYLQGKVSWDSHVLEGMNVFDHCMRQTASEKMLKIRRNFYPYDGEGHGMDAIIEIRKGYYAAPRLGQGKNVLINMDTVNTAFWIPAFGRNSLANVALNMVNIIRHHHKQPIFNQVEFAHALAPINFTDKRGKKAVVTTETFWHLRKFHKLKFHVFHRGKFDDSKLYTIKRIIFDPKYGLDGAIPTKVFFDKKMPDGSIKSTSVHQHYLDTYDFYLEYAHLPLIETTRGGYFPMELCNVAKDQRYPFKLSPEQTAEMIKTAVTRPPKRRAAIMEGFNMMKYHEDPYLREFGIQVQPSMVRTEARVIKNPVVTFGNETIDPKLAGRWDLRGKRFVEPNRQSLDAWGFVVAGNCVTRHAAETFASEFMRAYKNHGGTVTKRAHIMEYPFAKGDYGDFCKFAYEELKSQFTTFPDIIFFVIPDKNQVNYERIKKNMDCRFVTLSQVLQAGHVKQCKPQYISNVAMKVNAKLGGSTCRVAPANARGSPFFKVPTMIIGVDVTHHGADTPSASIAAITMSVDKFATRYLACAEANGQKEEILRPELIQSLFPRMVRNWKSINGLPEHVYYFRDGTDEGQFRTILEVEVEEFRRVFRELNMPPPKFTVIVATKRHHIRFFPSGNAGDKNGNPLPGTLVDQDATHPTHYDFYLCSHVAIQGTARPVHYQVLLDEAGVPPNHLQKMIYHQCYQYVRSTTPVSLHPSMYYAHLAAGRAKCHEDVASSKKEIVTGKEGFPLAADPLDVYSKAVYKGAIIPLLPMNQPGLPKDKVAFTNTTMWFI